MTTHRSLLRGRSSRAKEVDACLSPPLRRESTSRSRDRQPCALARKTRATGRHSSRRRREPVQPATAGGAVPIAVVPPSSSSSRASSPVRVLHGGRVRLLRVPIPARYDDYKQTSKQASFRKAGLTIHHRPPPPPPPTSPSDNFFFFFFFFCLGVLCYVGSGRHERARVGAHACTPPPRTPTRPRCVARHGSSWAWAPATGSTARPSPPAAAQAAPGAHLRSKE
jgi:hypothetical protein